MTGPDITIRAAQREDAPALTTLANLPGVRHGTARLPFTRQSDVESRLEAPGLHVLVAELDGTLVGQAFLVQQRGRRGHAAEIGLYVHDDFVGRGVGTELLRALIDVADNWLGLRRIELTVNTDNDAAIRLYDRFGFEREGIKRADILRAGKLVDCYLMARLKPAPEVDRS